MVNTRSKCRLLRNDPTPKSTEQVESSSSTEKTGKRKRNRNGEKNDNNTHILTNSTMTTTSSLTSLINDPVHIESVYVSHTSIEPYAHTTEIIDGEYHEEAVQPLSSPQLNLSGILSLEAVDDASDDHRDVDHNKHLGTSYLLNNPSDSEEENFDHNLHLQQQILIDVLNREENEENEEIVQSGDANPNAVASPSISSCTSNSWPIEVDNLEWTKTRMKGDCLIMGNFSYIYMSTSEKKNAINFRCQQRDVKCRAVVHLSLDKSSVIDTNDINHNHPPNKFSIKQKMLNQRIDDRLGAEPTAILRVIERVYAEANLTDEEQLNIRLPRTAASTFYKKRSRRYPAHPKTQEFDIPQIYSINNREENFVIYDGNKERLGGRLLIFSTPKLLSALFNSTIIFCDGTFKTRPLLFQQVYVLMGKFHGEVIPLVWCLTSSKAQPIYDTIWKKLGKIAKNMRIEWKVEQFMMDFERAMINSSHEGFQNADIKCCWYHFVQALWRKIQNIGLTVPYESDPLVNSWFKQFMALPLISKELIYDAVQLLKETVPSNDQKYNKFLKYFQKEYMDRTSMDLWHHGNNDVRTNNSLEGYNFRLLTRFGVHPSIWQFFHLLKDEESLASHRITQLGGGSGTTLNTLVYSIMQSRRRADKSKNHLLNLEHLFVSKSISLKEYLKSASLMVGKIAGQNINVNNIAPVEGDEYLNQDEDENE